MERRIRAAARGLAIGHQLGQWSERRWWHHLPEAGPDPSLPLATALADPRWLSEALADPPRITTPGWVPTGVGDLLPLIDALCAEGRGSPVGVSPEAFRELLLRERGRLMPQAVGRTCIELMAGGHVDGLRFISKTISLEELPAMMLEAQEGKYLKIVVKP